jgi:hypothetical protein
LAVVAVVRALVLGGRHRAQVVLAVVVQESKAVQVRLHWPRDFQEPSAERAQQAGALFG